MNTYYHYSSQINDNQLYDSLLGCGLFAEKIPDFLCSQEFLTYSKRIDLPIDKKPRDYIRYKSLRNTNIPRSLSIPEPFAYATQCLELKHNWARIQKHFEKKTKYDSHKVSRIHLRKLKQNCAIFEMNYKNFDLDGAPEFDLKVKSRFVVEADISQCFPSIYSHSIPWALKGKSNAKANRNKTLWFNKLDKVTQNIKYGETNGILIGPHSSNLISEIVLTTVDRELTRKGYKYLRFIDDYQCYCQSYEKAEKFLLDLSNELSKYELSLNLKKSGIHSLPKASVKNWINKLNNFIFVNTYSKNNKTYIRLKELKGFIAYSTELFLEEDKNSAVLNYAIQIISNKNLGVNAKNYFIKSVHHLVLQFPYLIHILDRHVFVAHDVSIQSIKGISNNLYELGLKNKTYEPCSYAIFWAIKYQFTLNSQNIKKESLKSEDCIFMLLGFLYDSKHHIKSYLKEYRDTAKNLKSKDFDRYWLFVYEVLTQGNLPNEYSNLKKNNISFIKKGFSNK